VANMSSPALKRTCGGFWRALGGPTMGRNGENVQRTVRICVVALAGGARLADLDVEGKVELASLVRAVGQTELATPCA
jgi:hypothetical protein